jgi:hypothetical protein
MSAFAITLPIAILIGWLLIVLFFLAGAWLVERREKVVYWSRWRIVALFLSSIVIIVLFSTRPVRLNESVFGKVTVQPGAGGPLVEIELKKANEEIQFRIAQEDTWYHYKFLLVGGVLAGFFGVLQFSGAARVPVTQIVRSEKVCSALALTCVVALAIDIHLRNNIVVIQQLALWIANYAEPAMMPAAAGGFVPWEKFLRTPGAGMHSDEWYGFLFYPHLHFLTWVLYLLYLTCFHWIALKAVRKPRPAEQDALLAGGFVLVHVAVAVFAFMGHFVPRALEMNVLPMADSWRTGAAAACAYLLGALLLVAINSPYLVRFLIPSIFREAKS